MVERDIEEVEAIDLDIREATKVPQLWTGGVRLVRCEGIRLSCCSNLKGNSFVCLIVCNFGSCCCSMW